MLTTKVFQSLSSSAIYVEMKEKARIEQIKRIKTDVYPMVQAMPAPKGTPAVKAVLRMKDKRRQLTRSAIQQALRVQAMQEAAKALEEREYLNWVIAQQNKRNG